MQTRSMGAVLSALLLASCGGGSDGGTPPVLAQKVACADLKASDLDLAQTGPAELTSSTLVAATTSMPEHCRVEGVLHPETGSNIKFAVDVPTGTWNGKFLMLGNGGYAGEAPRPAGADVANGYATATTDTGHAAAEGGRAFFNNRIKEIDYGYRGVHLTAVAGKQIARALGGKDPDHSYFNGCSTGGRQALMEAQRYPGDFDGIIAGSPAANLTGLAIEQNWSLRQLQKNNYAGNLVGKVGLLASAVKAACADAGDPLGLISHPENCHFDPGTLLCTAGQDPATCLTAAQVDAVREIYAGPHTSSGVQWYAGKPLGSEPSWAAWLVADPNAANGWNPLQGGFAFSFVNNLFFETDPPDTYVWNQFNFDVDPYQQGFMAGILNATNPDLSAFKARNGKLLIYHGTGDGLIGYQPTQDYYQRVQATVSGTNAFARLFLVPGMDHCDAFPRGAVSVAGSTWLGALEKWVEAGTAPDAVAGRNRSGDATSFTRPVCAWPKVATYNGSGDRLDAANYSCQ